MTVAQKGTIMESTMVLSTNTPARKRWADVGLRACDERLVTVAEADALRASRAASQLPAAVSRRK